MRHETRIQPSSENFALLMPENPNKDVASRLLFFIEWLDEQGLPWYKPNLPLYCNHLLRHRRRPNARGEMIDAPLSPVTVQAHLASIRGRYQALLNSNTIREHLYDALPPGLSPADRKAAVDEMLVRLENDVHPRNTPVPTIDFRDVADSAHLRLNPDQVRALLRAPGLDKLIPLRDTAILAMLICTGIREAELVELDVDDLRQTLNGELALRVRAGKGDAQRLVPYGPLDWCLVYVDRWLEEAEITSGPVFRGVYKGEKHVRDTRITSRAINQIMCRYPISINGVMTVVQPHDLRRTYARTAYLHGMDMERIRQNLGHTSLQTTQMYIGALKADERRPPDMFSLPHSNQELSDANRVGRGKKASVIVRKRRKHN
ncbi:MAG: tyrosine-type recombinase/integrase [Anaerolineae bacterium]|nr:tyrosine-type recombinase/integrase [Anaerolineae bacterium]MDW8171553.1 tyrosine-type recombinase/integrase [Anaerolineae bacterium]